MKYILEAEFELSGQEAKKTLVVEALTNFSLMKNWRGFMKNIRDEFPGAVIFHLLIQEKTKITMEEVREHFIA